MNGTLITRLFGIFLVVWATMELPRTVYVTAQGYQGEWLGIVALGVVPFVLPILFGVLIARHPGILYKHSPEAHSRSDHSFAMIVVGLMGLYLIIDGLLDLIFQIGLAILTYREHGKYFDDPESSANTIASFVEVHAGAFLVIRAKSIAARISKPSQPKG